MTDYHESSPLDSPIKSNKMKILSRKKVFICYIATIWIAGILLSYVFMGSKSNSLEVPDSLSVFHSYHSKRINLSDARLELFKTYCNPLEVPINGKEGLSSDKFKLRFVSVLIRHGDRGPLLLNTGNSSDEDSFCGISRDEEIIFSNFADDISTNRVPVKYYNYSRIPSSENCKSSMLSKVGAMQLYKVGSYLNERYRNYAKFLSDEISTKSIQTFFTTKSRTFQSALAFLYGFSPDMLKHINEIPMLETSTTLCFSKEFCHCKLVKHLEALLKRKSEELVSSHPAISSLLTTINRIMTGHEEPIKPTIGIDLLSLPFCHSKYYPCSSRTGKCLGPEHIQRLMSYVEWSTAKLVDDPDYQKASRIKSQGFFVHLLENILGKIIPQKKNTGDQPHFVLYSGHDTNLEAVLMSIGHRFTMIPPYASRLAFEIYSYNLEEQQVTYLIRIIYNGKDITQYTSFCKDFWMKSKPIENNEDIAWCPLDNFIEFVNNSYLKLMKVKNYFEACKVKFDH